MTKKYPAIFFITVLTFFWLSLCTSVYCDFIDSDNDGMPDSWETTYNLNNSINDADNDNDNDSVVNLHEFYHNTNPLNSDSDNDGLSDAYEINSSYMGCSSITELDSFVRHLIDYRAEVDITSDGSKHFIVWNDEASTEDQYGIFGYLLDLQGNKTGNLLHLNTYVSEKQLYPSIATNGTNYLVSWQSYGQDGDDFGIYAQLFDNNANKINDEFKVNSFTGNSQYFSRICSNGDNYFAVWSSVQDGSGSGVYGQIISNNGSKIGSEFKINTHTLSTQNSSKIATNGSRYFVVWKSYDQDNSLEGVYGQIFDNEGSRINQEFKINTCTLYSQKFCAIASDGNNFLAAWQSNAQDGSGYGIFAQLFDQSGNKIGSEFQINTSTAADQEFCDVSSNGRNYLICWESKNTNNIHAQLIDLNGNKISSEFTLNESAGIQYSPKISTDGTKYIVSWYTETTGADEVKLQSALIQQFYQTDPSKADTDNDGLEDPAELFVFSTQPNNPDTDNDGLSDWQEIIDYSTDPLNPDSDNDGIPDGWEVDNGFNPLNNDINNDADNDGLNIFEEFYNNTDPTNPDSDNDGLTDGQEMLTCSTDPLNPDSDNDGLIDGDEINIYETNPNNRDTDYDTMPDGWEVNNNLNPLIHDTNLDNDNDGASNITEFMNNTSANNSDSDNDGMPDGWEINNDLNPLTDDSLLDLDNEGLTNIEEYQFGTFANNADSDSDGLNDYDEVTIYQTLPNKNDSDNDGLTDDVEIFIHFTSALNPDSDNDGLTDYEEIFSIEGTASSSDEFQINTYTSNYQKNANVATDGTNYLIVWESRYQDGSGYGIYGQLVDSNGTKIGSELHISSRTSNDQLKPYAASNGNNYLVTWQSYGQDGSYEGIYGQFFDLNGNKIGSEFRINYTTYRNQRNPSIATDNNNYLITWQSYRQDGSYEGVYAQLYDSAGNKIGSEFRINNYTNGSQCDPSIASNGINYLVTWQSNYQDGSNYGIYGQLYNSEGDEIGSEFRINSYTSNDQKYPNVKTNGNNYFVTWYSIYQDGSGYGIYGQIYGSDGTKVGQEIRINSYTLDYQLYPSGASNGNSFFITWQSEGQDGSGRGIYGQFFTSDGLKIKTEFQINEYTLNSQEYPSVASNGNNYLIAWESYDQDGSYDAVMAKIINLGTDPLNPDSDNDGLTDGEEILIYQSNPMNSDTDGDGFEDGWEADNNLNPAVHESMTDSDNDGLSNLYELQNGTLFDHPDSDNDGMPDGWEVNNNLDPLQDDTLSDADNDGLNNLEEYNLGTNANNIDTDGDGLLDKWEVDNNFNPAVHESLIDNDNDGLSNLYELQNGTGVNNPDSDNDGLIDGAEVNNHNSNPLLVDTDNDGLTDRDEVVDYGTFAYNPDTDGDGLTDYDEIFVYSTNPLSTDTDNDGINDNFEITNNLNPLEDDSFMDPDNDGLTNLQEYNENTATHNPDSDNDGLLDGQEVSSYGTNPLSPDSDNDGVEDFPELFDHSTDPLNPDSDGDTMFDGWEITNGLNPNSPDDALLDPDNDGIINKKEYFFGSSIYLTDTDNDGLDDSLEILDLGAEFRINSATSLNQSAPSIACNGNNYLVVWEHQGYYNRNIHAQFFDKQGSKIGSEFRVNTYTTHYQMAGNVTTDGTNYLVTWQSSDQDGDDFGVFGKILNEQGDEVCPEIQINTYTPHYQAYPCAASNGSNYFIVWRSTEQDGMGYGIVGRLLDNEGNMLGDEKIINAHTCFDQQEPSIATDGNNYFVVWNSAKKNLSPPEYRLCGQVYDSQGDKIGIEIHFNEYTSHYQFSPTIASDGTNFFITAGSKNGEQTYSEFEENKAGNSGYNSGSSGSGSIGYSQDLLINNYYSGYSSSLIVFDSSDSLTQMTWDASLSEAEPIEWILLPAHLIAWDNDTVEPDNSETAFGSDYNDYLYYMNGYVYGSEGQPVLYPWILYGPTEDKLSSQKIISDGTNYFLLYANNGEIYGQFFNPALTLVGPTITFNHYISSRHALPVAATDGTNYLVVWESNGQDGSRDGIYGRMLYFGYDTNPANPDTDNDGLNDSEEINTYLTNPMFTDSDNDGLNDLEELVTYNTDPIFFDTDYDYLTDGDEVNIYKTSPLTDDTDNDGIYDDTELFYCNTNPLNPDSDNDGLSDLVEFFMLATNPNSNDTDNDGMLDFYEIDNLLNPFEDDTLIDKDNDGLTNIEEFNLNTSANNPDSDNDGMFDGWEIDNNLNPFVDDSQLDNDGDLVPAIDEFRFGGRPDTSHSDNDTIGDYDEIYVHHTNPSNPDTDNDNLNDYDEIFVYLTNPTSKDTDGDGILDGDEISAFTNPHEADNTFERTRTSGTYTIKTESYNGLTTKISTTYDSIGQSSDISYRPPVKSVVYEIKLWFDDDNLFLNSDSDRMPDWWENFNSTDPTRDDSFEDLDNDSLDNELEYVIGSKPDNTDSDGDILPDGWEYLRGTDPTIFDAFEDYDNDGLSNFEEYFYLTDPWNPDTDGDGLSDKYELTNLKNPNIADYTYNVDRQSSNYTIVPENISSGVTTFSRSPNFSNFSVLEGLKLPPFTSSVNFRIYPWYKYYANINSDTDRIPDWFEVLYGTDKLINDENDDLDNDGLTNIDEYVLDTSPSNSDTDFDNIPDKWEVQNGTDPKQNDSSDDPDNDGLNNLEEQQNNTDPFNKDTDGDGVPDGDEITAGTNPNIADSTFDIARSSSNYSLKFENFNSFGGQSESLNYSSFYFNIVSFISNVTASLNYKLLLGIFNVVYTDSDNDGIPDSYEILTATNPAVNDALNDPDNDGLTNLAESQYGSHPLLSDTDNDGQNDYFEYKAGTNPKDKNSIFNCHINYSGLSGITLVWFGKTGNLYTIMYKEAPEDDFKVYLSNINIVKSGLHIFMDTGFDKNYDGDYMDEGEISPPEYRQNHRRFYKVIIE